MHKRFIGIHLRLEGQTSAAALDSLMAKFPEICDVQCFTHGPQSVKPVKINIAEFKARLASHKVRLWIHGSYLSVPWSSPFLLHHTMANFRTAHELGAGCVVVHLPFREVKFIVDGITPLVKKIREEKMFPTMLMLETSATRQDTEKSYESPDKLNALSAALIDAGFNDCVRICIDTAHIFAGRANIREYKDVVTYCDALDKRLIGMIHLNGNSIDPDKGRGDRHEIPLTSPDLIWSGKTYATSGCKAFIDMGIALNIPIILEVNPTHSLESIREFINLATVDVTKDSVKPATQLPNKKDAIV
jgi:endonuclease IV